MHGTARAALYALRTYKVTNFKHLPIKINSFDLYALNEHVTVADVKNVPIKDESMDVVVFCLSLMGTNLADFILEANRILKQNGHLKIAEVRSRFGAKETVGLKTVTKNTCFSRNNCR